MSEGGTTLDRILREDALQTVFQPIVELRSGSPIGYEALIRGPGGIPADSLVAAAYQSGRVVEFDWAARASASRAALAADLDPGTLLFFNIEPLALDSESPADLRPDIDAAFNRFSVVLEVTERSLDRDPASLLNGVDRQRPNVAGLALDDVGSRTVALAMMPVLSADVVKLDLSVTQGGVSRHAMEVVDASYEEAERTGAVILAEGVETEAQAEHAARLGAQLAQGYFFGEPRPLDSQGARVNRLGARLGVNRVADVATPFAALAGRVISRAGREMLTALGQQVVHGGVELMKPAMVLVLVPDIEAITADDRRSLAELAQRGVVTAVLGRGVPREPALGVRGCSPDDGLLDGEWAVIALGSNTAGALLARGVPEVGGEFEFGVTHDRSRVIAAARTLLRRVEAMADA
jgi:EAL domain-containing protein (putative c-di-GMP-specific phosphodiesterase class I)